MTTLKHRQPVMVRTLGQYWHGTIYGSPIISGIGAYVYIVDIPAIKYGNNVYPRNKIFTMEEYKEMTNPSPKSELLAPGVEQIPFEGLEAIGQIFSEGEKKYGKGNWKLQPNNEEYNTERTRHAIRHLMLWANGDRSEPHLAKVAWFCVTSLWREKQVNSTNSEA